MPECYIRGSTIKYLRIPDEIIDMVREEAAKGRGRGGPQQQKQQKGRGMGGAGRGRVTMRARWGREGYLDTLLSAPCTVSMEDIVVWAPVGLGRGGLFSQVEYNLASPTGPLHSGVGHRREDPCPCPGKLVSTLPLLSCAGVFGGRGRGGIPGAGRGQPEKKPGRQAGKQ